MKLDIGSGEKNPKTPLDEWTHLDISPFPHVEIVCDFGQISLDGGSVEEIFLGDVIEHIPMWRQDEVLKEWNRILKVGGLLTGRTPDADSILRRYARGDKDMSLRDTLGGLFGSGELPTQQHYITFSKETLMGLLARYGFGVFDFSGSPGPAHEPWWLVWTCRKITEVARG
jgi:predicted SAM-dependent methyltransferase